LPDTSLSILIYAVILIAFAIAIKVALRLRADRRRHSCCVFCDGVDGEHAYCCTRPGGRV
jgi:hypothetical protein